MRRRNSVMVGLLALGLGGILLPSTTPVRAEITQQPQSLRTLVPSPSDTFHYTSGILTFANGDVDGDGDIDIVGADFYGASNAGSKLWLNDGTGTFEEPVPLSKQINNATDVELVDLDADTDLDLVVARTEEFPELVAFNSGDGRFEEIKEFDAGFTFQIVVADFDGDDDPDILTVNENDPDPFEPHPTDNRERLWLNDGSGVFTETARLDFGYWANIDHADLDGDRDLDLVISHTEHTTVWKNDGAAHFTVAQEFPPNQGGVQALGDLDGDGDLDTLSVPWGTETVSVGVNDGTGIFTFKADRVEGFVSGALRLVDFDHDNDLDAINASWSNETHKLLLNDGRGDFSIAQTFGGQTVSHVMIADVNNDSWADIIAGHNPHISQDPSQPSIWLNTESEIRGTLYLPLMIK